MYFNQFVSPSDSVVRMSEVAQLRKYLLFIHSYYGKICKDHGVPVKPEKNLTTCCCIYAHFITVWKHFERWDSEISLKVSCCVLFAIV